MLVMPRQKELIALKIENTPEFYIEIGKFLDEQNYTIVKDDKYHKKYLFLIDNMGNKIETTEDNYILIDYTTGKFFAYIKKEDFKNNFIELKEEN